MRDITNNFGTLYYPKSALVFYQKKGRGNDTYVEHFDMDKNGNPINAHPLTVLEAERLAKALNTEERKKEPFLRPKGIMKSNILHINPQSGRTIWYTKEQPRNLLFSDGLEIPDGKANIPPMLWVADRNSLSVFALAKSRRPTENTALYYAPFFNIYDSGNVCMGSVDVAIKPTASLEEFTDMWEGYFFNSYFSHLMNGHNPVKGNCVLLWKSLVNTDRPFPMDVLIPVNRMTIKKLIR